MLGGRRWWRRRWCRRRLRRHRDGLVLKRRVVLPRSSSRAARTRSDRRIFSSPSTSEPKSRSDPSLPVRREQLQRRQAREDLLAALRAPILLLPLSRSRPRGRRAARATAAGASARQSSSPPVLFVGRGAPSSSPPSVPRRPASAARRRRRRRYVGDGAFQRLGRAARTSAAEIGRLRRPSAPAEPLAGAIGCRRGCRHDCAVAGRAGARSFACRSRSVALARAAASSWSSRPPRRRPVENLLCRLGLPRTLAAGDRASREKPLLLLRAGGEPRGGGEKPVPLRIWYVSKGPIQAKAIAHR